MCERCEQAPLLKYDADILMSTKTHFFKYNNIMFYKSVHSSTVYFITNDKLEEFSGVTYFII
jgi:hypothetical protein